MSKKSTRTLVGLTLLAAAACGNMDVVNPNAPDRDRALAKPGDLEAMLGGSFQLWFERSTGGTDQGTIRVIGAMGPVHTVVGFAATEVTEEPRRAFRPDLAAGGPALHTQIFWVAAAQVAANAHDFVRTSQERGITFSEGGRDVTPRATAFAKFVQGLGWGYQTMMFDRAILVPETEPFTSNASAQAADRLVSWGVGLEMAVRSLEEAIAIAGQHSFTFPSNSQSSLWFGTPAPMTNVQFSQLANTMAARLLVQSARRPSDRAALDWNRVLQFTANGLASDFEVVLASGRRTSTYLGFIENNNAGCVSFCARLRYELIGPADISGAYQSWRQTSVSERDRFDIVTPDRRITGPTPQSAGAYVRWFEDNNGFPSTLGHYRRSAYQWRRHTHEGFTATTGTAKIATVDENNLLRAEALIHLGRLDEAAALINITRTRVHRLPNGLVYPGLPPVTAAGVPPGADCVPRTDAGACGDLLVALRYERMLELVGLDQIRGWADARGFGMLHEGTPIHLPMPGTEQEILGMGLTYYTFGGVGTEFGAKYDPVTLANFRQ